MAGTSVQRVTAVQKHATGCVRMCVCGQGIWGYEFEKVKVKMQFVAFVLCDQKSILGKGTCLRNFVCACVVGARRG